jgi:hypothetical protein
MRQELTLASIVSTLKPHESGLVARRLLLASAFGFAVVAASGCWTAPVEPENDEGSVVEAAEVDDDSWALLLAAQSTPEVLATLPAPSFVAGSLPAQTCGADSDCRVIQPSDWSAGVECCYEYGCDLDYVAVNQDAFRIWRSWKAANPFDCQTHLQENGPCENRASRCGFVQDPPEAACVMGTCQVALPEVWPVVDEQAQSCTVSAECRVVNLGGATPQAQCCSNNCNANWAALNDATFAEYSTYQAMLPALECAAVSCLQEECAAEPPIAACDTGMCRLR